jgi:uncharacterized damage-inducible protein DinB
MNTRTVTFVMTALCVGAVSATAQEPMAGKVFTLAAAMQRAYHDVQRNLAEAADKMPEAQYSFKPTAEIKPFAQLVAHAALAQFRTCAWLKGEANPRKDEKEDSARTKSDAMTLLKASTTYCDPAVDALTESAMSELTTVEQVQAAKGLAPAELVVHGMEMYGTMSVYLRLKGIVPPTTERESQMKMKMETKKGQ